MGRKPLPPSMRAQPISFSLKPHLIEKIDDYCHDHRFNRSKFLMEAVTQYMLKTDLHSSFSSNVNDMSIDRRVAVGLAALQEANRAGVPINKNIMDVLRRELGVINVEEDFDKSDFDKSDDTNLIEFSKTRGGRYEVHVNGSRHSTIYRVGRAWIWSSDEETNYKTLSLAKEAATEELE